MANSVIRTTEVDVLKLVKETRQTVNLEMSIAEAQTLSVILAYVGGDPMSSLRKHASAISHALYDSGLRTPYRVIDEIVDNKQKVCGIHFKANTLAVFAESNS